MQDDVEVIEIPEQRVDTEIRVTFGYASQTHWLTVIREYVNQKTYEVEYADMLFSFWLHPFYKRGGVGPVPRKG
jgi:hypothetical protein